MALKRVNVMVDGDLLDRARALGINRSAVFQRALETEVGWATRSDDTIVRLTFGAWDTESGEEVGQREVAFLGRFVCEQVDEEGEGQYYREDRSVFYVTSKRNVLMYDPDEGRHRVIAGDEVAEAKFLTPQTKSQLLRALGLEDVEWLDI